MHECARPTAGQARGCRLAQPSARPLAVCTEPGDEQPKHGRVPGRAEPPAAASTCRRNRWLPSVPGRQRPPLRWRCPPAAIAQAQRHGHVNVQDEKQTPWSSSASDRERTLHSRRTGALCHNRNVRVCVCRAARWRDRGRARPGGVCGCSRRPCEPAAADAAAAVAGASAPRAAVAAVAAVAGGSGQRQRRVRRRGGGAAAGGRRCSAGAAAAGAHAVPATQVCGGVGSEPAGGAPFALRYSCCVCQTLAALEYR